MQLQGEQDETIDHLSRGNLDGAPINDSERALLVLTELLTLNPHRTTAADIDRVRAAGWDDEQIAEAVYVTAMFAMMNRIADAFGLEDPNYRAMAADGGTPPKPAERAEPE